MSTSVATPRAGRPLRRTLVAMGSDVELILAHPAAGSAGALDAAEREIRRLEAIFSRFRPASALSRLNRDGVLEAPPELVELIRLALDARERTGGRFDPTVHDAVVAAGYDRSFEDVPADGPAVEGGAPCGGRVTVEGSTIRLEAGFRLDLGGIAKGYAADRACAVLSAAGPCLVNTGGDLAVRGVPPEGVWPVAVEVPGAALTLGLRSGGIATSGRDHRCWRRGGRTLHHLVDPATGRSSASSLLRVTAFGATAALAEVHAKALLLADEARAVAEADALGIPAVLVTGDQRVIRVGGLA